MAIRAIIFDCFGVLTTDKWKEFVGTLPNNLRKQARAVNHAWDSGVISEADFISQIENLTGHNPGEVEATVEGDLNKNIVLLDYIATFKGRYKIGLLSNVASNWVREKFLTKADQALFDEMILSFEVGMTKPNPKIFELTAERLGAEPDECVLVDDIESYCEAARGVGMRAIWYKDFAQMKRELEQILAGK